jgi:hypothetical protein
MDNGVIGVTGVFVAENATAAFNLLKENVIIQST